MPEQISLSGISSISALGSTTEEVWRNYNSRRSVFAKRLFGASEKWVAELTPGADDLLGELKRESTSYSKLDRSVLLAILASRSLRQVFPANKSRIGINLGSSRGATGLFEDYHSEFLKSGNVSAYTSPTTTLGNLSSWVAQDLKIDGFAMGHSVTCSTALHAILNGIAWLRSGMVDGFLAGGAEAPLTEFTLAQMTAMKLYSKSENNFASESMRFQKKKNTMVLGEGAAVSFMERGISNRTIAIIEGYGFASEKLEHSTSISEDGKCFQRSMHMALETAGIDTVDCLVMHAPGTVKGDLAELRAIDKIFGKKPPLLTSNKWLIGHMFAASGMMSMEMAILMLTKNKLIENPFFDNRRHLPKEIKTVMVNAVGFGGNAVSIIISKP